jgi:DNA polymerase I-like protein with 3'-5' exonuclease and polymerase domains
MIINCDAKALEWVVGSYLSQDKIAIQEIIDKVDQHSLNQKAFGLPSRLIAKIFVFRLMYGGSAYAYANDPDFSSVSSSEKYWQKVIDAFYNKYTGLRDWHIKIVQEAIQNGQLIMPTGRIYKFELGRNYKGEFKAPETIIKNYPVQGLGADLMSIARISFMKRFRDANINGILVNTVHDSIVCDIMESEVRRTVEIFHSVFNDIPINFNRLFGVEFNLPLACEVSVGKNMKELTEYKI